MSWQSNLKKRLENNKIKSKQQLLLFDSDKIDILSYVKATNDKGITINGWKIIEKDYICDMNDFDDNKNKQVWGYDVSVEKTLICRPNTNITESSLIKYEDTYYKIIKIRKCKNTTIDNWDAYYKIALSKNEQQNIKIIVGGV